MFNVDPGDYSLGADIYEEQARDDANRKLAELALQTGLITRDQYRQFLSMPRAKQTEFAAGLPANFVNASKRFGPLLNPSSSWASSIFGAPGRDPKSGAWGTRDVFGDFRPFTPAPTPTPTSTPPVPATPASSERSPIGKIFEHIFGAFGAPSPFGAAATPTPIPTATPMPTPVSTPTSQPTGMVRSVLMKWPDGYVQPVRLDNIQRALDQGAAPMF